MNRRIGYAEREYAMVMARKKKEQRKQTAMAVGVIGAFAGLVTLLYVGLWMWANGGMS